MVPRPALGYAMVALAAALFAVNGTVSKIILGSEISAQQLTEVRCAGALVGLTLIAFATRPSSLRLQRSELPLLVALGVGGLALVQWSYFFAIHRVEIGIALVIQFVGPILVALWARFVYGEHVRRRIWLAHVLALTGLVLIVELWKAQRPDGAGLAAAALAAVTYAGYILRAVRARRLRAAPHQRDARGNHRDARTRARNLRRMGLVGRNSEPSASVRRNRYARRHRDRPDIALAPRIPLGATPISPVWGRQPLFSNSRLPRMLTQRQVFSVLLIVFAVLLPVSGAQARGLSSPEASLFSTMNAVRASSGLPRLRVDYNLVRAARGHSADMMHRQYFAHGSVAGRAVAAGARGPLFGEDLAWATGLTPQWVVDHWLASPAHRAVLLRPGFRRVGIGISFGTFIGHGGAAVVTADFAGR